MNIIIMARIKLNFLKNVMVKGPKFSCKNFLSRPKPFGRKKNWRAVPLNERFVTVLWLKDGD